MNNIYGEIENNQDIIITSGNNKENLYILVLSNNTLKFQSIDNVKTRDIIIFKIVYYDNKSFSLMYKDKYLDGNKFLTEQKLYSIPKLPVLSGYSYSLGLEFTSDEFSSINIVKFLPLEWYDTKKRSGINYLLICLKKKEYKGYTSNKWEDISYCEINQKCGNCYGVCNNNETCVKVNNESYLCKTDEKYYQNLITIFIYIILVVLIYSVGINLLNSFTQ